MIGVKVTEIIYTPIQSAATRVAALLSGEVDFIQDAPVQDLGRVAKQDGLKVVTAPQNRVIFFGMQLFFGLINTNNKYLKTLITDSFTFNNILHPRPLVPNPSEV